jgi:hypothetical protein
MSTFRIFTDQSEQDMAKQLTEILIKARVNDKIVYQGPNQYDQMWYIITENNGKKDYAYMSAPCEYY